MYYRDIQPYKLVNLEKQLRGPVLARVDMNLPASHGRIEQDALRMRVYAHVLEMYSEYAGVVVMTHQGRKGDDDFTSLSPHLRALRKLLPRDVELDFVSHENIFSAETRERISRLSRRQVLLLDNMRYFDEERAWDPRTCSYIHYFKGVVDTCVNDSMPTWHREDSSLMCLPYVARTYIGLRSAYELRVLHDIVTNDEPKALVMGGAKLQKVSDLAMIAKGGVEIFSGGLAGQLIARANGWRLGDDNDKFLQGRFTAEEYDDARALTHLADAAGKPSVHHPVDFVVEHNGSRENVKLADLKNSRGLIKDIGEETLETYATSLQEKPMRIRAGPLGVYEESYQNGLELTKRIGGDGLIFLGGDTSQELNEGGLLGHIEDSGGRICVSGGSFLHGWAGGKFPPLEALASQPIELLERAQTATA